MFKGLVAVLVLVVSFAVQADMSKPAILALKCVDPIGENTNIYISSGFGVSIVEADGVKYQGKQLVAVTEGGPAYVQTVNNKAGYNILIDGEDLSKAFQNSLTIQSGKAKASVSLFRKGRYPYTADCEGLISFK